MKRIQSLDLARGFTVLMIAPIHTMIMYSKPQVQQSMLGDIFAFIAEQPGAQLFMLIMGITFNFSSRINPRSVLKRTLSLFIAAYALNGLKFLVPLYFGFMPQHLLHELNLTNNTEAAIFFLKLGDILHFASVAYPLTYLVYRLKNYQYWSLFFVIVITIGSPYLWDRTSNFTFLNYILQLIGGHPPQVFFPLLPWLVYPLAGLSLGYFLKGGETKFVFKTTGALGILMIVASLFAPESTIQTAYLPFYRTYPADTLFHLGFVLFWIFLFHWLSRKITAPNFIFQLFTFCSKNITTIYIIQWILICWCMILTGYQRFGLLDTCYWMFFTTSTSISLTWLIKREYEKRKSL